MVEEQVNDLIYKTLSHFSVKHLNNLTYNDEYLFSEKNLQPKYDVIDDIMSEHVEEMPLEEKANFIQQLHMEYIRTQNHTQQWHTYQLDRQVEALNESLSIFDLNTKLKAYFHNHDVHMVTDREVIWLQLVPSLVYRLKKSPSKLPYFIYVVWYQGQYFFSNRTKLHSTITQIVANVFGFVSAERIDLNSPRVSELNAMCQNKDNHLYHYRHAVSYRAKSSIQPTGLAAKRKVLQDKTDTLFGPAFVKLPKLNKISYKIDRLFADKSIPGMVGTPFAMKLTFKGQDIFGGLQDLEMAGMVKQYPGFIIRTPGCGLSTVTVSGSVGNQNVTQHDA